LSNHCNFLESLYHTASKPCAGYEQQLQALLKIGCERFGMDIGLVTDVHSDTYEVLAAHETGSNLFPTGEAFELANTICARAMNSDQVLYLDSSDAVAMRGLEVPIDFLLYTGAAIRINGQAFGTLCFIRQEPHEITAKEISADEVGILMLIIAAIIERNLHLQSEQKIQQIASIVETSDDAIFTENFDRLITTWNKSAEKLYGYSAEQIIGKPSRQLYPEDEGQLVEPMLKSVQRGERTSAVELVHLRRDGSTVNISMNLSPINGPDGKVIAVSVVVRDIDERKRAEQALAHSEERYALAATGSNDGLWDWDLLTNQVYFSPRWKSILGYEEYEIGQTPEAWTDLIDTCDATQFHADLAFHLAGQTEHLHNEHRVTTKSGEQRWVLCRGVAVRDKQGVSVRIAGSLTDISKQKMSEKALLQQAQHDKLTSLPNRALFTEILRTALARSKRSADYKFAVLFLDFDRFKVINDSLGHEFGDMMLINIAQQLRVQLRTVDTAARLGGDEFVVFLDGIDGISGAIEVAERLLTRFSKPHNIRGHEVISTASIGIVTSDGEYRRPDELIRDADTAMYQAKASGKARYVVFDEQMHAKALQRLHLEKDLRKAISLGQMWVAYQPIVDLEDGTLRGFEALLRWDHPELGPVGPDQFIVLAEETGEIVALGDWVLKQACQQLVDWKRDHSCASDLYININISKRQVAQPDVVKKLVQLFNNTGINPCDVKLEITESVIMDDRHGITPVLDEIRSLGVQLAMDDFGTGHSSLSCLHQFPINVLKIDREFIMNMEQRIEYTAVTQAIISLAHTLNISVVAEGIETPAQVAQLQALECDTAQGYYFSKPLNAKDAGEFILNSQNTRKLSA
jgi:diguanylate cyclase (GGDEF)-like protein/PAS domain S-box-containing protein